MQNANWSKKCYSHYLHKIKIDKNDQKPKVLLRAHKKKEQ